MLPAPLLVLLAGSATVLPAVTHYDLRFDLAPASGRLEAEARMVIRNPGAVPIATVPVALYRLFLVRAATGDEGNALEFSQSVERLADPDRFQVLLLRVRLREPLRPGETTVIRLQYAGPYLGATEVWPYLHDRVSEPYSLLRPDALAYPLVSDLERLVIGPDSRFTATVEVSVPSGYVVASGGIAGPPASHGDGDRYRFVTAQPTWRIDIAAARFRILRDDARQLTVYHLAADSAGAFRVLEAAQSGSATLRRWFGPSRAVQGFTVIEIPEGWGSQAGDGYLLQAGGAFADPARVGEVYHEIGHGWNATAGPEVQPTRWFDEAFASYFQALVMGEVQGSRARDSQLARYRAAYRRAVARDPLAASLPIVRYGEAGRGGLSYTKGAWSLHVLHLALGDEVFRKLVRRWLPGREQPVTFEGFAMLASAVGGTGIRRWADDWLFGADSSALLLGEASAGAMAARYR